MRISRSVAAFAASCALLALVPAAAIAKDTGFTVTDLVTDPTGGGPLIDANLVNPWGLAAGPSTPLWVADNGTSMATIYAGATKQNPGFATFRPPVTVGAADPTGQVFNGNPDAFGGARFIFASESGGIAAFTSGNTAPQVASVGNGAVLKGIAIARSHGRPMLYVTDFHNDAVDVFDSSFQMTGSFTDPNAPAGFAPFGIQAIGDRLYVSFAEQDAAAHDDAAGPGHGVIDIFRPDGRLQRRLVTGGALNSPWGMAVAPGAFGPFHHDLLVGNFGDGAINAYDKESGRFRGALPVPLIDGLWGLRFGNGVAGERNALLFSAGPNDENGGRLGEILATKG